MAPISLMHGIWTLERRNYFEVKKTIDIPIKEREKKDRRL